MFPPQVSALESFTNRLKLRSVITASEESALHGLPGRIIQVGAHQDFVHLGQNVDHACLVVAGLVGRFGQSRDGSRQITCLYIPGDMPDLHSIVSPTISWGLTALTPTTIMRLAHTDLREIAACHFGIAEAFWRDCVADGSIFSEWTVNVGRRAASARLAHLFCEMAIRCERAGQGNRHSFALPITQNDLADATGLTNVHVNRTLRELRSRTIVTARSKMVTIHDWPQLVSIADFDQAFLLLNRTNSGMSAAASRPRRGG